VLAAAELERAAAAPEPQDAALAAAELERAAAAAEPQDAVLAAAELERAAAAPEPQDAVLAAAELERVAFVAVASTVASPIHAARSGTCRNGWNSFVAARADNGSPHIRSGRSAMAREAVSIDDPIDPIRVDAYSSRDPSAHPIAEVRPQASREKIRVAGGSSAQECAV
jgi:hypothetical protein